MLSRYTCIYLYSIFTPFSSSLVLKGRASLVPSGFLQTVPWEFWPSEPERTPPQDDVNMLSFLNSRSIIKWNVKKKSQWRLRWKEFQAFQRNSQRFITLSDKPATWKSQLLFDTVIKYQTTLTFFKTTYGQCSFSQSESPSNVVAFDTHGKTFVWEQNPLGFSFYSSSRMRNCRLFFLTAQQSCDKVKPL